MSSVTEVFGALGDWRIDLHPDTPRAVTDQLNMAGAGFATLIVTPVASEHLNFGWEGLHAHSIYAGMYRRRDGNPMELSGPGLWGYLGNEEGVGPLAGAGLGANQTFTQWVAALDLSPFITVGTLPSFTQNWTTDRVMTYRECLEVLQEVVGSHPFVGNDLHIDHRTMKITSEPPVWGDFAAAPYDDGVLPIFVPWAMSRESRASSGLEVIRGEMRVSEHVEKYLSRCVVTGASGTATVDISAHPHSYPGGGGTVRQERYIQDGSIPNADVANVAANEVDRYEYPTVVVEFVTDDPSLPARVKPAATVLLYDPAEGIFDFDEPMRHVGGQVMWPTLNWVESMRWPIPPNHGVYMRFSDDSILNLSEWYVPGAGMSTVTFGEPMQTLVTGKVSERTIRRKL